MAYNNLLQYIAYNKRFVIHINFSDFQLVVGIRQEGKLIALYSKKPTAPPKSYTVIEN